MYAVIFWIIKLGELRERGKNSHILGHIVLYLRRAQTVRIYIGMCTTHSLTIIARGRALNEHTNALRAHAIRASPLQVPSQWYNMWYIWCQLSPEKWPKNQSISCEPTPRVSRRTVIHRVCDRMARASLRSAGVWFSHHHNDPRPSQNGMLLKYDLITRYTTK